MSAILLENDGEKSSSKRARHLTFEHSVFMVTDQAEKGHIIIECCPATVMIGDFMTKGLQGVEFAKFCREIMGH